MNARIVASIACVLIFCDAVRGDCRTSSPTWQNTAMTPQSGQFAVEFDATPSSATTNGITALSLGAGSAFNDYAILIRFRGDGRIVVRNGSVYAFDVEVFYSPGSSHHVRVQADLPNHVYSVWVTPPSGPEVKIATDYALRDSQNTVVSLDNWGIWSGSGALEVCNFAYEDCRTSSPTWQNTAMTPQSGQFAVEFDATPSSATTNGITALSLGAGSAFNDYAILIRFRGDGRIVVRNGSVYAFDVEVFYTPGSSHHIRLQIDVPNHVHSVWVTPPSGPEVKIATDYAFRDSQNTVERLDNWGIWSGSGAIDVCNFGIAPMDPLVTLVTSAGLVLDNAELLWIRSHGPMDSVQLILGDSIQSVQQYADQWLYFATSACLVWNGEATGCLASTMGLGMTSDVHYDLVVWTEAEDRREPDREMVVIAENWAFHPADVNMDGVLDCADLAWFSASPYDWKLDGEVTVADLNEVAAVLSAALADLDRDGMVNIMDLLALFTNWGPCPSAGPCPGDLDCDGAVEIEDYLLLLTVIGP